MPHLPAPSLRPARLLLLPTLLILLPLGGCEDGGESPPLADTAPESEAPDNARDAAPDSAAVHTTVDSMLSSSAASWNAGDLEGFLDDYSAGPGLTFVGGSGRIRGLDEVRARYRASYWAPGTERDSLRFEDVEVRSLGPRHALAVGRYVLYRPGDTPAAGGGESGGTGDAEEERARGWFTLVLEKEGEEWRIIHDHSS